MVHERLLPDKSVALARLMYAAWELGLDGSSSTAADLLVVATRKFLKNIITAVIGRRKGYRIENNFVHGVGEPVSNPWLRNVASRPAKKFHSLKCDPTENGILTPAERPSHEYLEEDIAFKLASSDCDTIPLPITLYDLIATLKVYPSLVASNFVYTVNCERIWARICHPSWDD
ncbi:hypothetical protein AAG570_011160 [Ranatra chinensis]|uniref:Uncharacterized protein n=1 Tax=Ranatra chinensis TaxID=642074 RepID=A0ABD0Z630_9HEMI